MTTKRIHALAAGALLLAACGGGDDAKAPAVTVAYRGPTGAATISEANIGKIAISATDATALLSDTSGSYAGVVGASRAPSAGVKQAMQIIAGMRRGGTSLAGVIVSDRAPCQGGGSGTVRISDADGDLDTTSAGDWVDVAFDRCADGAGAMIDGSLRLTILETTGGDPFDPSSVVGTATFALQMTFTNFAVFDASGLFAGLHGDVAFDFTVDQPSGTISYEISGQSMAGAEGAGGAVASAFLLTGTEAGSGYSERLVETYGSGFYDPVEVAWGFTGRI